MARAWLLSIPLVLTACAPTKSETRPGTLPEASCPIGEKHWASSPTGFNNRLSAEVASQLLSVAQGDQDAYRTNPDSKQIGAGWAQLSAAENSTSFISEEVVGLAVRLRQLDCAVLGGGFRSNPSQANDRYTQIVSELEVQKRKLNL